jgi:hypothetical protein
MAESSKALPEAAHVLDRVRHLIADLGFNVAEHPAPDSAGLIGSIERDGRFLRVHVQVTSGATTESVDYGVIQRQRLR